MANGLQFPKGDRKAERRGRQRQIADRRVSFGTEVRRLDAEIRGHLRCMNIYCLFLYNRNPEFLHAMHILPREANLPERDEPTNGIMGCVMCHDMADGRQQAKDREGVILTPRQFKLYLLEQHIGQPYFRWHNAYEELLRKEGRSYEEMRREK